VNQRSWPSGRFFPFFIREVSRSRRVPPGIPPFFTPIHTFPGRISIILSLHFVYRSGRTIFKVYIGGPPLLAPPTLCAARREPSLLMRARRFFFFVSTAHWVWHVFSILRLLLSPPWYGPPLSRSEPARDGRSASTSPLDFSLFRACATLRGRKRRPFPVPSPILQTFFHLYTSIFPYDIFSFAIESFEKYSPPLRASDSGHESLLALLSTIPTFRLFFLPNAGSVVVFS